MYFNKNDIVFRRYEQHTMYRVLRDDCGPTILARHLDGLGDDVILDREGLLLAQRYNPDPYTLRKD